MLTTARKTFASSMPDSMEVPPPPASNVRPIVLDGRRQEAALALRPLVLDAIESTPGGARKIARHLGVSPDLVYGWSYGRSLPTAADLLAAPNAFGRRLCGLLGARIDMVALVRTDPQEAKEALARAIGRMMANESRGLEQSTEEELRKQEQQMEDVERYARTAKELYRAELLRRIAEKGGAK